MLLHKENRTQPLGLVKTMLFCSVNVCANVGTEGSAKFRCVAVQMLFIRSLTVGDTTEGGADSR